jgi:prepilin-type N-terminal cleavage/methylation domain-containing protein
VRRRRNAGFTLLEMLLALTLLSLIVGSILGGLHLGKRVWETGRDYEAVNEVEEAATAIADLLGRSFPTIVPRENALPTAYFDGQSSSCRLVTSSEGDSQWGGLLLTEVGVVPSAHGTTLAVWTKVFRADDRADLKRDAMQMTPALRDVTAFEMSYFGTREPDRPPDWGSAWANRLQPPQLISLRIAAKRFGRLINISMTVELRQR